MIRPFTTTIATARMVTQKGRRVGVSVKATKEQFVNYNSYLLFESIPDYSHITKSDIDYAFDLCQDIPEPEVRHECYAVFGINGEMMDKYYLVVSNLERCYYHLSCKHPVEDAGADAE